MGTKDVQVVVVVILLILICYNLLQNNSCRVADKTEELINKNRLATKRFLKAMQTDGTYSKQDFLNPLIRSGKIVNKKGYIHLLKGMSEKDVGNLVSQFHINGTEYLDDEAKRDFLWCDPELLSTQNQPARRVYRPCAEMRFRENGKRIALASFPGSGSTWSRTLLEQATGIYTGAIYCDKNLKREGFVGEFITSGNVIAIKTHQHLVNISKPDRKHTVPFDGAIFIIRNVLDAVFSERKRSASKNHTGQLDKDDFVDNMEWQRYALSAGYRYQQTVERWLKEPKIPLIVVRYEDLVKDTKTQLERMLDFLDYPYTEERLDCVISHQIETFHRKHDHEFDPFTTRQHLRLLGIMKSVEPLLNKYGTSYSDWYAFS